MAARIATAAFVLAVCASLWAHGQDRFGAEELEALVRERKSPYFLVDVRTPEEFAEGHIPTAVNIPYQTIVEAPPTRDKGALIIVYCRSGSRSRTAQQMLQKAGYQHVVDFGGIGGWKGPLEKP